MSKSKSIFKCKLCEQRFEKQEDLKEHKRNQHASDGKFVCEQCDKSFAEEWKLTAHIKTHKSYPCNQCDKIFIHKETELKHIREQHMNILDFIALTSITEKNALITTNVYIAFAKGGAHLPIAHTLRLLSAQEL